jgi:hypothetical protein
MHVHGLIRPTPESISLPNIQITCVACINVRTLSCELHSQFEAVVPTWQKMVEVVITIDFEVLIKNIEFPKIRDIKTIPTYLRGYNKSPCFTYKNTPNMASTNNKSGIPSLSAPVPLHGNDGQRYSDGLPQLFVGQKRLPAAAATGKHRHRTSMMRCAFTC